MPKRKPPRQYAYSPRILWAIHFANEEFIKDYVQLWGEIRRQQFPLGDILNKRGEAGRLFRGFKQKYPLFSQEPQHCSPGAVRVIPNFNPREDPIFLHNMVALYGTGKTNKPDYTLHLFPDPLPPHETWDEGLPPATPSDSLDEKGKPGLEILTTRPVSEEPPRIRRRLGRFLRLQIDLYRPLEDINKQLFGYVHFYRKDMLNSGTELGRIREKELEEYLRLANLALQAKEQGVAPQTLFDAKKFAKKTSQNKKEWDKLTKKFSRARKRAKDLFRELGLPTG